MDAPTRFCPSCGNQVLPGAAFCNGCGASTGGQGAPTSQQAAPVGGHQGPGWWYRQKTWAKITILVAPLLVIGLGVGLPLGLVDRSNDKAAQDLLLVQEQDQAAKALVRNSMTAIESAYVDLRTFDVSVMTPQALNEIEPSIVFIPASDPALAPSGISALAKDHEVSYSGYDQMYGVGTTSESGKAFGVAVNKGAGGGVRFYIDGKEADWDKAAAEEAAGATDASKPTGQRAKAFDANAKSLVRNSMTAIESAYVDTRTFDPAVMTPEVLRSIEPSIDFRLSIGTVAATAPRAPTADLAVEYFGTATTYAVGSLSESGKTFGVIVDKGAGGGNQFYVDGKATDW